MLQCEGLNETQDRVAGYLGVFVGNLSTDLLRRFLRFVTGSSVCLAEKIEVCFNNLDGLARRPISHTCDCALELSIVYGSYPDFADEFQQILVDNEFCWDMDAL